MPRFPIAESQANLTSLLQGQPVAGTWQTPDTPPSGGPALMFRWDIDSIYLPIGIATAGPAPPTICYLTVQILLSGELAWQGYQQIPLTTITPIGWQGGSAVIADSLPAPLSFNNGQRFEIGYTVYLNADGSWMTLALAGRIVNVTGTPGIGPAPASIGYKEVFRPLMVTG
jgi:hypothetical protein